MLRALLAVSEIPVGEIPEVADEWMLEVEVFVTETAPDRGVEGADQDRDDHDICRSLIFQACYVPDGISTSSTQSQSVAGASAGRSLCSS